MKRVLVSRTFPIGINSLRSHDKIISPAWSSESKSANLLLQSGMIVPCSAGMFHYTPLMLRSLNKLKTLIDKHMVKIDGQKIHMASLGTEEMWKKSGRWREFGDELIRTRIGSSKFCLSPTHEEAVCTIISMYIKQLSHVHLPIRLYQTTTKYRAELRPHAGLLRCREFLMNDLYTFDIDTESATETYYEVMEMYDNLFRILGVDVLKATARTGFIGGVMSHEYHIPCQVGEDTIAVFSETGEMWNSEHPKAKQLIENSNAVELVRGTEVGHIFLLGSKYSKRFKAVYVDKAGKAQPCEMGCYGLGVSRIVASCLEALSTDTEMRWPDCLAPYKVCIIPPKSGSKEESALSKSLVDDIYTSLQGLPSVNDDVIIDDRNKQTIGWRLKQASLLGYPAIIVIGKGIRNADPTVEVIFQGKQTLAKHVPISNVTECINERFQDKMMIH